MSGAAYEVHFDIPVEAVAMATNPNGRMSEPSP